MYKPTAKFPYPYDRYTLAQVENMLHTGLITQSQYEDYYHVWYTSSFHFSNPIPCYCHICQNATVKLVAD